MSPRSPSARTSTGFPFALGVPCVARSTFLCDSCRFASISGGLPRAIRSYVFCSVAITSSLWSSMYFCKASTSAVDSCKIDALGIVAPFHVRNDVVDGDARHLNPGLPLRLTISIGSMSRPPPERNTFPHCTSDASSANLRHARPQIRSSPPTRRPIFYESTAGTPRRPLAQLAVPLVVLAQFSRSGREMSACRPVRGRAGRLRLSVLAVSGFMSQLP